MASSPSTIPTEAATTAAAPTIGQRLGKLVNNDDHADLHFVLVDDDNRRISAHRLIVATGSEELHRIVYGSGHQLKGTATDGSATISVNDITADAFVELLRYIYTDTVTLTDDNVFDILRKSNYYGLQALQRLCSAHLVAALSPENCLPVYANLYGQSAFPELVTACLRYIRYAPVDIAFRHDNWSDCSAAAVRAILTSDAINCDDAALFQALVTWARQRCELRRRTHRADEPSVTHSTEEAVSVSELRSEIGDLDGCIRWGTMSVPHFDRSVQLVPGLYSPLQVHEMRSRCDVAEKRREWLTCQNAVWASVVYGDSGIIHPAAFSSSHQRFRPMYVGRYSTFECHQPSSAKLALRMIEHGSFGPATNQHSPYIVNESDNHEQVLVGDNYTWLDVDSLEMDGMPPHGSVVLEDVGSVESTPTFIGRIHSDLVTVDWQSATWRGLRAEDEPSKLATGEGFQLLVGRNVLPPVDETAENIPDDAMRIDFDSNGDTADIVVANGEQNRTPLYLGRVSYGTDVLPAIINHDRRSASTSWNCAERIVQRYVFLRGLDGGASVQWVASSNGTILPLAVVGGQTNQNEKLYIGRVRLTDAAIVLGRSQAAAAGADVDVAAVGGSAVARVGEWRVGKVHPSHRTMYVGVNGAECSFEEYELLVWRDATSVTAEHEDFAEVFSHDGSENSFDYAVNYDNRFHNNE